MLRNNTRDIYIKHIFVFRDFFLFSSSYRQDLRGITEKRKKISEDDEDEYEELFRGRRRKIIEEVCNEDDLVELAGVHLWLRQGHENDDVVEEKSSVISHGGRMGTFHGMMRYFDITWAFHVPL